MHTHDDASRAGRRHFFAGIGGALAWAAAGPALAAVPPAPAVDTAVLARAVERARGLDQLHSLIVGHRGAPVFAEAFRGPGLEVPANIKSASKSVIGALVGIAIDRGLLEGVNQPVAPILGEWVPADADPRVAEITVDHLLTMRAGLERTSGPNYGRWVQSGNWVGFVLSRPFIDVPGGRMLYSTGDYHVLSAVLTRVSGESVLTLAREWLGAPLGIEIPAWTRDPQGIYLGGNNMALSPHALFTFGEMMRRGGSWQGARVVSEAWIADSWIPRTRSPFSGDDYGYSWFAAEIGGQDVRYARGYGGQMIYVVPALELTVVVTSDPGRPARSDGYVGDLRAMLAEDVIPAVGV
jgi:CubicO group peptidase (beta-lactamase class C family)